MNDPHSDNFRNAKYFAKKQLFSIWKMTLSPLFASNILFFTKDDDAF